MPRIEEVLIYKFEELSDAAKEKARDWYRSSGLHDGWWDGVYEQAERAAAILGIDIDRERQGNGRISCIFFSGFCSQGDGASWTGSYRYTKGALKAIKKEWPLTWKHPDGQTIVSEGAPELHRIAQGLQDVQRRHFYKLTATVTRGAGSNHYSHSNTMAVDVEHDDDRYRDIGDAEDDIKQLLRDFADWIYSELEREHDYLNSDEAVDETIIANEYEFDEGGSTA
jgi:hypothetical protein